MSDPKKTQNSSETKSKESSFDDLEDAFFATGDAESFWEDDDGQPQAEPAKEEAEEAVNGGPVAAVSVQADESDEPAAPESPSVAVPEPTGEFYNPSALHPAPDLIMDDETEVLSPGDEDFPVPEHGPKGDAGEASETVQPVEAAPERAREALSQPAAVDATTPYRPPESVEEGWLEASLSLQRESNELTGEVKASLLSEAGRILLSRAGRWESAGLCFEAAIDAGLPAHDVPKGYADVVASQGRFTELRDLLVSRGKALKGAAAVEALQDAAIVERNHLKDDAAAVTLLNTALGYGDDWFTLRLLRELHYRTREWESLTDVLARMAVLGSGARSARCKVEEGRIRETELNDLDGAANAYGEALGFDGTFMDAFLARQRATKAQEDWVGLSELYVSEAKKCDGENASFWWLRAAKTQQKHSEDLAEESFRKAMETAGGASWSVYREAQVWFAKAGRMQALYDALVREVESIEAPRNTAALLYLGQAFGGDHELSTKALAQLQVGFSADSTCGPLAFRVASMLKQAGKHADAIDTLSQHLETIEDLQARALVVLHQGEIAELLMNKPADAAAFYETAYGLDANHAFAAMGAARCWAASGNHSKAVEILEKLANSASESDEVSRIWFRISNIHRNGTGNSEAADAAAKRSFDASSVQPAAIDAWIDSLESKGNAEALAAGLSEVSQMLSNPTAKLEAAYRAARIFADVCGSYDKARPLLQRCVELDPHCVPVLSLLRHVCERLGDWATVYDLRRMEAATCVENERVWHLIEAANATHHTDTLDAQTVALEILGEDKSNSGALASLERAALERGDAHRLVGVYRRIRSGSEDLGARTAYSVRLADVASGARDKQLAIRSITRVLEASVGPRPYGAMARLAVELEAWSLAEAALHADGDLVGLARLLEATSEDQKRIAATWRSITKKEPGHLEAHGGLERALSRLGSRDGLADTHAALAEHEKDPSISTMHALLAGHLYENEETPGKALEFYGRAFKQSSFRGKAFEALVRIHAENKDENAIRGLFTEIKVDDPIALAEALHDADADVTGIYKQVIQNIGKAAGVSELPIYVRYEMCLEASENWTEVFKVLDFRLSCSSSEDERTLIELKRRWVLSERMADSDEAWNFYRELHEKQPEDREVLENLARIAGARGERELAIQFLDGLSNIAETADDAARYQRRVAEVHLANGAKADARASFLRALDHLPDDVEAMEGIKALALEAEDWQSLVGILSREFEVREGDEQIALAKEIAVIWEDRLGDGAVAADSWRTVIELAPGDQTALQHLVLLAENQGDWASFINEGKSLVHFLDGEERAGLLARMGRAAMQHLRREDEAVRLLDEASTCTPPNLQAAEDLEKIYAARGSWDLVIECTLRRARASEPAEAVELFLQAARSKRDQLRDRKGAAAVYDEALSIDPGQPEALRFKGYFLFDTSNLEGAVEVFKLLESTETEVDLDDFDVQMDQALYYFRFGDALRRLDRLTDAVGRYEQALALNASHLPTLEAIGPLYVAMESWDAANRTFRQVLQLTGGQGDPARLARVYACLGTVEQAQGNVAKAVQRFKKALELQPNDVEALSGYACVLFAQKDWNNLLNAYNNIIYHAKEKSAFVDAYLMKGFVLDVHMSLSDKAAQHYEKSLSFVPSHPIALLRLSELALRKEEWDRALSYAGRALSVGGQVTDKVRGSLMLVQAVAYGNTERPEEAQAALEGAQTVSKEVKELIQADTVDVDKIHETLRGNMSLGL